MGAAGHCLYRVHPSSHSGSVIRIPEIVDAINLQPEGPAEASRAIRKKLKYGNTHRQLRALTVSPTVNPCPSPILSNGECGNRFSEPWSRTAGRSSSVRADLPLFCHSFSLMLPI